MDVLVLEVVVSVLVDVVVLDRKPPFIVLPSSDSFRFQTFRDIYPRYPSRRSIRND